MSGEPVLVDNTGRTWPRITKDNAAQHPYPSLRHCKERGPGTAPYCWYLQISGEPTWDQEYTPFNLCRAIFYLFMRISRIATMLSRLATACRRC